VDKNPPSKGVSWYGWDSGLLLQAAYRTGVNPEFVTTLASHALGRLDNASEESRNAES
jgi:hypothetical protein